MLHEVFMERHIVRHTNESKVRVSMYLLVGKLKKRSFPVEWNVGFFGQLVVTLIFVKNSNDLHLTPILSSVSYFCGLHRRAYRLMLNVLTQ